MEGTISTIIGSKSTLTGALIKNAEREGFEPSSISGISDFEANSNFRTPLLVGFFNFLAQFVGTVYHNAAFNFFNVATHEFKVSIVPSK